MNIFATSPNPYSSAVWLDDKRVNKMITESAQMLSTYVHEFGAAAYVLRHGPIYRPTHAQHPCVRWLVADLCNFRWLLRHAEHLASIYADTNHRVHGAWPIVRAIREYANERGVTWDEPISFQNSARNADHACDFTHLPVHEAYQQYLLFRWNETDREWPTWRGRAIPSFVPADSPIRLAAVCAGGYTGKPSFLKGLTNGTDS
jgi:hypothetical protein